VTGGWRELDYEEIQNLFFAKYNKNDQIKEDVIGRA
jgi:hypothetical protein